MLAQKWMLCASRWTKCFFNSKWSILFSELFLPHFFKLWSFNPALKWCLKKKKLSPLFWIYQKENCELLSSDYFIFCNLLALFVCLKGRAERADCQNESSCLAENYKQFKFILKLGGFSQKNSASPLTPELPPVLWSSSWGTQPLRAIHGSRMACLPCSVIIPWGLFAIWQIFPSQTHHTETYCWFLVTSKPISDLYLFQLLLSLSCFRFSSRQRENLPLALFLFYRSLCQYTLGPLGVFLCPCQ